MKLINMLHVPQLQKHLLSITHLTNGNNVLVEFTNCYVFMKDNATKRILLKGLLKDGLYQVHLPKDFHDAPRTYLFHLNNVSNSFRCFSSKSPLCKLWQYRLGHPNPCYR